MKQSEKLKVLIDSIKTANELMKKQIEINGRAVELLGEFITEPEKVEPETIKPEDMIIGNWYVTDDGYLFKFIHINKMDIWAEKTCLMKKRYYHHSKGCFGHEKNSTYRKATQEEILKYFPNELEVDTHGGNDAGHIASLTDLQLKKLIDIQL